MDKNMDNLESLSNDELRTRLLQFGFPNLPVTSTTRKVLIKKLRNHVDGENAKTRRETVHVAKYSSDDDSEVEIKTKTTMTSDRRATINVSMRPPSVGPEKGNKRRSGRITPSKPDLLLSSQAPIIEDIAEDTDEEINSLLQNSRRSKSKSPSRVRVAKKAKTPPVEIIEVDDEEEEEEEEGEYISPVKPVTPSRSTRTTITHNYNTTRASATDYAVSPAVSEILARKRYTIGDGAGVSSPNAYSRPTISTSYNRYETSNSGLSNRYTSGGQNYSTASTAYAADDTEGDIDIESTAPYLSDFTRRLSTLRAEPLAGSRAIIYRTSTATASRNPISTATKKTSIAESAKVFLTALDRKYKVKRNLSLLLAIIILIFIVVFFLL